MKITDIDLPSKDGTRSGEFTDFLKKYWPSLGAIFFCIVLVVAMVYLMTTPSASTPLSNALITGILTAASCAISYIVTKIFAEQSYNRELRDHSVQIARGLMGLKTQIGELGDWVGAKRTLFSQAKQTDAASDAAFEHVELTLQNFAGLADNAVGGIAGVIGAAYSQYEDFIGIVSRIRVEGQRQTSEIEKAMPFASPNDVEKLQKQIAEISTKTEEQISFLAKSASLPIPPAPAKRIFTTPCPICAVGISVEMIDRPGETKPIKCASCGSHFNAHVSATRQIFTRMIASGDVRLAPNPSELVQRNWLNEYDIRAEAVALLKRTSAYVEPTYIDTVVKHTLKHDQLLSSANQPRTPWNLLKSMLDDPEPNGSLPKIAMRRFIKLAAAGGAFGRSDKESIEFTKLYTDVLTPSGLIHALAAAVIDRLSNLRPISKNHVKTLSSVIFGDEADEKQNIVESVLGRKSSVP